MNRDPKSSRAALRAPSGDTRILIVRTSAMGDIIHCLPVLTALRRALPAAHLGWVVESTFAPLLEGHPDLDEILVVKTRSWRGSRLLSPGVWRQIGSSLGRLRAFGADIALDLMGNHKGGLLARLSGARQVVGPARENRRESSSALWIDHPAAISSTHAVDRALDVAAALGVERGDADFGAGKLLAREPEEARAFLAGRPPYLVIQAGAGWANKTYPARWWGQVACELRERTGLDVWVPIAPGEEHLARAVVEASAGAARSVDATPFPFLAALLRHSRLVLGGDTGPIHLAVALEKPVLCVIGPTDPARNGPYPLAGRTLDEQVLWHRLPCSGCYRRFAEPKACLLNLAPEHVVRKALALLL